VLNVPRVFLSSGEQSAGRPRLRPPGWRKASPSCEPGWPSCAARRCLQPATTSYVQASTSPSPSF